MRRWRKNNPTKALKQNRKDQKTWRDKNVQTNRMRAKYGIRILKLKRRIRALKGVITKLKGVQNG